MDLWAVHVKMASQSPYLRWNSFSEKPISSLNLRKMRVSNWNSSSFVYQPFVVRAMGKKNPHNSSSSSSSSSGNGDHSIPEEDGQIGNNPSSQGNKSSNSGSQKPHHKTLDWREFRAALYLEEQAAIGGSELDKQDEKALESRRLGPKWAHPLSSPETGCVLVATEKLDGDRNFERTVVFLLRCGHHPEDGPVGVVINRLLHKKLKHMKLSNLDLATTFADCPLHFGGPLEASIFVLRARGKTNLLGFEEVIPGVCFSARNGLEEAAVLVKKGVLEPRDVRFFEGYAGWDLNQLRGEIESHKWHVAACSSNLIFGESSNSPAEGLWEEILQQMGGHYSELSRKPKQDM